MSMDAARLAAIRAREQAATPGPWTHRPQTWPADAHSGACILHDVVAPFGTGPALISIALCRAVGVGMDRRGADAAFIAAARSDVPDLLAEIERLRTTAAALYDEARYARDVLYQHGFRWAGDVTPYPDNPYREPTAK